MSPTSLTQSCQSSPRSAPSDALQNDHDLAFVVEGQQLLVHCSVVCPKSAPIAHICAVAPGGTTRCIIQITDFNMLAVKRMLDYIYQDDYFSMPLPNSGEEYEHWVTQTIETYAIADRYAVQGLKEVAMSKLSAANTHFTNTKIQLNDAISIRLIQKVYERTSIHFLNNIRQMFCGLAMSRLNAFLHHADFWRVLKETDGIALDLLFRTYSCWKEETREAERLNLELTASRTENLQLTTELSGVKAELSRVRSELGEVRKRNRANSFANPSPQATPKKRVRHSPAHCHCPFGASPEHLEPSDDVTQLPKCLSCRHSVYFFSSGMDQGSSIDSDSTGLDGTSAFSILLNNKLEKDEKCMGIDDYAHGFGDN